MHVNKQLLLGRIGVKGPELRYNPQGTPYCSLVLETDKPGKDGKVYTSYHRVEITGRFSQDLAVTLEAGDEILVEGEHQYRSTIDAKTGQKRTTCVLSTGWVSQRTPADSPQAESSPLGTAPGSSAQVIVAPGGEGAMPAAKPRRRPYPKAALSGGFEPRQH